MKPDLEHGAKVAATFPNRLVETSAGWILLGPQLAPGLRREAVNISVFGPDGWTVYTGLWSRRDGEPLGAMLAAVCGIPSDEAERIADEVLEEWRSRGDPRRGRRERRSFLGFMLVAGVVVLLALLGVALAVRELVS